MLSKEPLFIEGFKTIPSEQRAKGFWSTERWIYGQLLGDKFIVGEMTNNRNGSEYKTKYEFNPGQICRCTGVTLLGQQDNYLYENDVIRNHLGQLLLIENKQNHWIARFIEDGEDEIMLDQVCNLKDYLHYLDNSETESVHYIGNIVEDIGLRELVRKNTGKRARVEELLEYLHKESSEANVIPVFVDDDGEEQYIDHPDALELINNILEQAYLPFLARKVIEGGWRKDGCDHA